MLTREKVRTFYDRFGALQDRQAFYEDIATRDLIAHANFEEAKTVFEFGCGTGRFAADLVGHRLAEKSSYTGCDLSATMVGIARGRLAQFGARAQVQLTDGTLHLAASDATFDRFVSNYVLDLLPSNDIALLLAQALRVLAPDGRICLVSGTHGVTHRALCRGRGRVCTACGRLSSEAAGLSNFWTSSTNAIGRLSIGTF